MLHIAHISPISYCQKLSDEGMLPRYRMVLAHLVLKYDSYKMVYCNESHGNYTILDNSAFELGESIDYDSFIKAIRAIHPNEIVLPDVLLDSEGTLRRMGEFIDRYGSELANVSLMAVPHGKELSQYIDSYERISSLDCISCIGIGAIYDFKFAHNGQLGREYLVDKIIEGGIVSSKPHHLLGLGSNGNMELSHMSKYLFMRSCDTSAAYVNARNGRHITPNGYEKDKKKVDFLAQFDGKIYRRMISNMEILDRSAV